jgi:zinc/manganese transport system permease protein
MNWSALDWSILGPAFIAGLLVLLTHVPLGAQVLDRGIVFIDLAIAQIAGLGVIAADAVGLPEGGVAVQIAAVVSALLGALLLTWTERKAPHQQEALIGVMFILAACAGILLLSGNPHGGEHLKDMLVGQILWVNPTQLIWLAAVSAVILLAMALGWVTKLGRFGFYGAFALAVTASVQLVGVYLVFSSLIIGNAVVKGCAAIRSLLRHWRCRLCAGTGTFGTVRFAFWSGYRLDAGVLCLGMGREITITADCSQRLRLIQLSDLLTRVSGQRLV